MSENKSQAAAGWPMLKGEYKIGNPDSCVAVVTCGSHLDDDALTHAGAAISGSCKTENLGVEKLVSHIIANPNIRFLIVAGSEVKGHITGEAILMLHQNGISKNRIVGAKGAIPYIENLSENSIQRFMNQIECVDMINVEDIDEISQKIQECAAKDPGAYPAEPLLQDVKEKNESEEENFEAGESASLAGGGVSVAEISSLTMVTRLKGLDQKISGVGDYYKYQAGYQTGKVEGFVIGFVITTTIMILIKLIMLL